MGFNLAKEGQRISVREVANYIFEPLCSSDKPRSHEFRRDSCQQKDWRSRLEHKNKKFKEVAAGPRMMN
jgi:hypothetical protein